MIALQRSYFIARGHPQAHNHSFHYIHGTGGQSERCNGSALRPPSPGRTTHQRARSRKVRAVVCETSGPALSLIGDPDILRVALDSCMGNRREEKDKDPLGPRCPEPALRFAKSSPHHPLSRYLSISLPLAHSLRCWFPFPRRRLVRPGTFFDDYRHGMSLPRAN